MMTELPSGEPLSVIFLDTEGTEQYLFISATIPLLLCAQVSLLATYQRLMMPRYFQWPLYSAPTSFTTLSRSDTSTNVTCVHASLKHNDTVNITDH